MDMTIENVAPLDKGERKILNQLSVDCQLLKSGRKKATFKYYFCSCDPFRKEVICEGCIKTCHKDHIWSAAEEGENICHCGLRGHKPFPKIAPELEYNLACYFYEYEEYAGTLKQYETAGGDRFCHFCKSFCSDFTGSDYRTVELASKADMQPCACKGDIHNDINKVFLKLEELTDPSKDNMLENLTINHLVNLNFRCPKMFSNIFSRFDQSIKEMKGAVARDDFAFEQNLKYANYFATTRFIRRWLENNDAVHNFSEALKEYLDPVFVTDLLKHKIDNFNDMAIHEFKYNCVYLFYKTVLKNAFKYLPHLSQPDYENFSPMQRIELSKAAARDIPLVSTFIKGKNNYNFVENAIDFLSKISQQGTHVLYLNFEIIYILTKCVFKFAIFKLIDKKQRLRCCKAFENLLSKHKLNKEEIDANKDKTAKIAPFLHIITNILSVFCFQFNDDVLVKGIEGPNEASFYHGKNEITALISKVSLLVSDKIINSEIEGYARDNVLSMVMKIISISINSPDSYIVGIKRVIQSKPEEQLKMLKPLEEYDPALKNAIIGMNDSAERMRDKFAKYFDLEVTIESLQQSTETEISQFFKLVGHEHFSTEKGSRGGLSSRRELNAEEDYAEQRENIRIVTENAVNNYMIKSDLLFSLLYMLKINKSYLVQAKQVNPFECFLPDTTMKAIIRFYSFFIESNPDNCMVLVATKFLKYFSFYLKNHFEDIIDLYYRAFKLLEESKFDLLNSKRVINFVDKVKEEVVSNKALFRFIPKVLKIYETLGNDFESVSNHKFISKTIKSKLKEIEQDFPTIKGYLEMLTHVGTLFKSQENQGSHSQILILAEQTEQRDLLPKVRAYSEGFEQKFDLDVSSADKIVTKYLKILNDMFDEAGSQGDVDFLEKLLPLEQIATILHNEGLNLSLRTQLMRFFRMVYIDVSLKDDSKHYVQSFIEGLSTPKTDDPQSDNFEFLYKLTSTSLDEGNFDLRFKIMSSELKRFEKIASNSSEYANSEAILIEFVENGLLLPLKVFYNKFQIMLHGKTNSEDQNAGVKNVQLYQLMLLFLKLKKSLIKVLDRSAESDDQLVNPDNPEIIALNKRTSKPVQTTKMFKMQSLQSKTRGNSFLTSFDKLVSSSKDLSEDISYCETDDFEIFNSREISKIFDKHFNSMIKKANSASLLKIFSKKKDGLEAKIKKLQTRKANKSEELINLEVLAIRYEIMKKEIDEGSFLDVLDELNYSYGQKYRILLIKLFLFVFKKEALYEVFEKDNINFFLKLLQYDTKNTQEQISQLSQAEDIEVVSPDVHIPLFTQKFISNFLTLLLYSYNPSSSNFNFEYYFATHYVKILKFYCEEHNDEFQDKFYNKKVTGLKGTNEGKSFLLMEFLFAVIDKIIQLSDWEQQSFASKRAPNQYFFDMFEALVEFLIEVVQGTNPENLRQFLNSKIFFSFIRRVKGFLLFDKVDTEMVTEVKINLMNLILAIIEEQNTPKELATQIAIELLPEKVMSSCLNSLKKLYLKQTNSTLPIKNYKQILFSKEQSSFFLKAYYHDEKLAGEQDFILALRMYRYVQVLASEPFTIKDALSITHIKDKYSPNEIEKLASSREEEGGVFASNSSSAKINKYTRKIVENYAVLSIFTEILIKIEVRYETGTNIKVYFEKHPLCKLVSRNTIKNFDDNVNRESRYQKLFEMMETCNFIHDEISFNAGLVSKFSLSRWFIKLNYYYITLAIFSLCLLVNILLIVSLETHTEAEINDGDDTYFLPIQILAIIQIALAAIFMLIWLYSKFPIYTQIATKKHAMKNNTETENISFLKKTSIVVFGVIGVSPEMVSFIMVIILGLIAITNPDLVWVLSLQLFIAVNLFETLENIVRAVVIKWNQLLAALMFVIICIFCFSLISFYYLRPLYLVWEENVGF